MRKKLKNIRDISFRYWQHSFLKVKGQEVFLILEDGTDMLSRNVSKQ